MKKVPPPLPTPTPMTQRSFKFTVTKFLKKGTPTSPDTYTCDVFLGYQHDYHPGISGVPAVRRVFVDKTHYEDGCSRVCPKDDFKSLKKLREEVGPKVESLQKEGMVHAIREAMTE
jgi:hypothetical protein